MSDNSGDWFPKLDNLPTKNSLVHTCLLNMQTQTAGDRQGPQEYNGGLEGSVGLGQVISEHIRQRWILQVERMRMEAAREQKDKQAHDSRVLEKKLQLAKRMIFQSGGC